MVVWPAQPFTEINTQQMIYDFLAGLCSVLLGLSGLMTFLSIAVFVVGLFQSAAHRREGVSFVTAIVSRNVMFRPELYTDAAARPRELHKMGLIGTFLFTLLGLAAGFILKNTF